MFIDPQRVHSCATRAVERHGRETPWISSSMRSGNLVGAGLSLRGYLPDGRGQAVGTSFRRALPLPAL
eukprot:6202621-Pleurochrysis_carterae.AAC.1